MAKRLAIVFVAILAAVGLLVAGALLWATSETGSAYISGKVREAVKRESGIEVTFTRIDLGLLPPRLALRDITARDGSGRIDCTIEEAEVSPEIIELLRGEFVIEEIYVGYPRCAVRLGAADIDALLAGEGPSPIEGRLDLSAVPAFEVLGVSGAGFDVAIDDPGRLGTWRVAVEGFGIDATGTDQGLEIRGLVERIGGSWREGEAAAEETVRGLDFRAQITPDAVDVRHLSVDAGGALLRLREAHVPFPLWPRGPDVADLSLDLPLDLPARLPLGLPALRGTASFLGQLSLARDDAGRTGLSGRGRLTVLDVRVDQFVIGDLTGLVSLSPRGVAFSETVLAAADGYLHLTGDIALDEQLSCNLKVRLERVELARLMEAVTFDGPYVTQRMSGTVRASGQLSPLRLDGALEVAVDDHRVFDAPFDDPRRELLLRVEHADVAGRFSVTTQRFEARGIDVRLPRSRLEVGMRFGFETGRGWELLARSASLDLADVGRVVGLEMTGRGPVSCSIKDPVYGDPRIVGSAALRDFSIQGMRLGEVSSGIRFSGSTLLFDGLTVRGARSRASTPEVRLEFGGREGLRIETTIHAEQVAVEELARIFGIDTRPYGSPEGFLFGRVALEYSARPEHLLVELDATHGGLVLFDERFGPDAIRARYADGELVVSEFGLTKGQGTISVTGAYLPDGSLNFVGVASGVDLGSINHPSLRELGISASGQAFAVLEGTLDHPRGRADVRLGNAVHGGLRYGPTRLELELDGRRITGRGRIGGEMLTIEHGVLDLGTDTFRVEAFADDLDLIRALGLSFGAVPVTARVTGELAVAGRLAARPRLEGHVQLERVRAQVGDLLIANKRPLRIAIERDRFRLDRARFLGPGLAFDLAGRADLETLNLQVSGLADLSLLERYVDGLGRSSGRVSLRTSISGPWRAPVFRGEAEVAGAAVTLRGFPYPVEEIAGRVILGPRVVRLEGFTARSAGGSLAAEGRIDLDGFAITDYRLLLRAESIDLAPIENVAFTASTTGDGLMLRPGREIDLGDGRKRRLPMITGDVEVERLLYSQDFRMVEASDLSVDRLTGTRMVTTSTRAVQEQDDVIGFDIALHGARNLEVRNNLLDAELRIDDVEDPLRILGTNQIFGFRGRVLTSRGELRFGGKRFDLRYGAVSWPDALRPENPSFRITADGQIRDWKVTLTARGNVDEYEIQLTSQPFLSKEDLVFLMLTGMTRAEHRQFGSTGIGGLGAPLLDQIGPGGQMPIPLEVRIYNEYSERAGTDTMRLSLGRSLTDDIWVAISSSVGQERDVKATLGYRISDSLSLSADYENVEETAIGNVGIDLRFRLEF
jgi:hypothetical protein